MLSEVGVRLFKKNLEGETVCYNMPLCYVDLFGI